MVLSGEFLDTTPLAMAPASGRMAATAHRATAWRRSWASVSRVSAALTGGVMVVAGREAPAGLTPGRHAPAGPAPRPPAGRHARAARGPHRRPPRTGESGAGRRGGS